jgi:hypothetical protein
MLKIYNSSYMCNNIAITASMMFTYLWLKFTDMLLFTMCVVTNIQTSNIVIS